jgi:CheY-like chemotaxis protein
MREWHCGTMAKILLIDDDPVVYELTNLMLGRAGHEVEWAKDGVEALGMMASPDLPDLVLCDILMPRMDGRQTLQAIRQDPRLRHLRVVMLTALSQSEDIEFARRMGALGYIVKPFRAGDLLRQVDKHLKPEKPATTRDPSPGPQPSR